MVPLERRKDGHILALLLRKDHGKLSSVVLTDMELVPVATGECTMSEMPLSFFCFALSACANYAVHFLAQFIALCGPVAVFSAVTVFLLVSFKVLNP